MRYFRRSAFLVILASIMVLNLNCGALNSMSESSLAVSHSSSILDIDLPDYKARIGDRIYVASVLADLFFPVGDVIDEADTESVAGKDAAEHLTPYVSSSFTDSDRSIARSIVANVLNQTTDFYGPCFYNQLDTTCSAARTNADARRFESEMDIIGPLTTSREGLRLTACIEITENDRAISNLIFNLTGDRDTIFSPAEHSSLIFEAFYSGKLPSSEISDGLEELSSFLQSQGETNVNVWRGLVYTVCKTSGWQIP